MDAEKRGRMKGEGEHKRGAGKEDCKGRAQVRGGVCKK